MRSVLSGRWKPCCLAAAPIGNIAAAPSLMRRATSSHVMPSIKTVFAPMCRAFYLSAGGDCRQNSRCDPAVQIARAAACRAVVIVIGREHLAEHAERDAICGLVPHHRFLGRELVEHRRHVLAPD